MFLLWVQCTKKYVKKSFFEKFFTLPSIMSATIFFVPSRLQNPIYEVSSCILRHCFACIGHYGRIPARAANHTVPSARRRAVHAQLAEVVRLAHVAQASGCLHKELQGAQGAAVAREDSLGFNGVGNIALLRNLRCQRVVDECHVHSHRNRSDNTYTIIQDIEKEFLWVRITSPSL